MADPGPGTHRVLSPAQLAARIDHTCLAADARAEDIIKLCQEAERYRFASVCVNSIWVPLCAKLLGASSVAVCTTVSFPLGAGVAAAKAFETEQAVAAGADEVDMVLWIGGLKDKRDDEVRDDIVGVVRAAAPGLVKVILETGLLTDEEKRRGCALAVEAGAHFVKTSTGHGRGATVEDVALLRRCVPAGVGVKASGGVRTFADAVAMIEAGASRIGTSSGVQMMMESQ